MRRNTINRDASAPLASARLGNSFEITRNRTRSIPVHGVAVFPIGGDAVFAADLQDAFGDRALICLCAEARIAYDFATCFPISGAIPKRSPRLARVGETALACPTRDVKIRAIVPLPERFGPTSRKAFWCVVSVVRQISKKFLKACNGFGVVTP